MAIRATTRRARRLRREASDAEQILRRALREMNLALKVRRQHPIGHHIADFAISARKLAIEIDGGQHGSTREADARRTRALNAHGYRVIRFWNHEILGNLAGVLQTIVAELQRPPPHPDPLRPEGRRGDQACGPSASFVGDCPQEGATARPNPWQARRARSRVGLGTGRKGPPFASRGKRATIR